MADKTIRELDSMIQSEEASTNLVATSSDGVDDSVLANKYDSQSFSEYVLSSHINNQWENYTAPQESAIITRKDTGSGTHGPFPDVIQNRVYYTEIQVTNLLTTPGTTEFASPVRYPQYVERGGLGYSAGGKAFSIESIAGAENGIDAFRVSLCGYVAVDGLIFNTVCDVGIISRISFGSRTIIGGSGDHRVSLYRADPALPTTWRSYAPFCFSFLTDSGLGAAFIQFEFLCAAGNVINTGAPFIGFNADLSITSFSGTFT